MALVEVYPDTNAFSYFVQRQGWPDDILATARATLVSAVRTGELRVIGSQFHLEELSGIHDVALYRRVTDFFWDVVGPFLLRPTTDLVEGEARVRRRLDGNERFDSWTRVHQIRAAMRQPEFAREIADAVHQMVVRTRTDSTESREQYRARLAADYDSRTPAEVIALWWANANAQIDDWTSDYLRVEADRLRFENDGILTPSSIPTARNLHAYLMARVFLNVGLNRRIGDGDIYDAHHYASGAYTDVVVTADAGLRETCGVIPNAVRTIDFEAFLQEHLGITRPT
jgi:hypothetical protein